jgi:hypothetical protein
MHEINDLGYCVCNVMEDAVIEEESMKEIDIRKALQYPFIIFLRLFLTLNIH